MVFQAYSQASFLQDIFHEAFNVWTFYTNLSGYSAICTFRGNVGLDGEEKIPQEEKLSF